MPASEEKIVKAVEHFRQLLDKRPHAPESLSQAPDSQLQVILKKAGAARRSPNVLARLQEALERAGIAPFPPLTDPFLKATDRICMLDAKHPIDMLASERELLPTEKDLQQHIFERRDQLDAFKKRGLSGFKEQVTLDGGRRVDILCERVSRNQLVAIELKAAQPDDRTVGQAQKYLDDLGRHAKNHGFDSAHLIVISGQPDKSVRERVEQHAASRGLTVEFLLYRVQTKLLPHP